MTSAAAASFLAIKNPATLVREGERARSLEPAGSQTSGATTRELQRRRRGHGGPAGGARREAAARRKWRGREAGREAVDGGRGGAAAGVRGAAPAPGPRRAIAARGLRRLRGTRCGALALAPPLALPQIRLRLVRSPPSPRSLFRVLARSVSSEMITPLICLRVVVRACVLQGARDAWGEGGAVDGGAVVGAPRVRVPQLPRESLHPCFIRFCLVGRTRTACSRCDLLHAFFGQEISSFLSFQFG